MVPHDAFRPKIPRYGHQLFQVTEPGKHLPLEDGAEDDKYGRCGDLVYLHDLEIFVTRAIVVLADRAKMSNYIANVVQYSRVTHDPHRLCYTHQGLEETRRSCNAKKAHVANLLALLSLMMANEYNDEVYS